MLLSPNIPSEQSLGTSITFTVPANKDAPSTANTCLITGGIFRLERASTDSDFRVVLPPPDLWFRTDYLISDQTSAIDQLYSFLLHVDDAERAGCFATSAIPVRDYILQNVHTPPGGSLFNAYGYVLERSGVNLKPNLRLKIERAYFNGSEKSDKDYLGISDVLFDVTTNPDGSLRFQQAQPIHYSPDSLAQTDHEGSRDLAILDLKPQKHYRVLFYTHQVPTNQNFSAAIIGADDSARLDEFEQTMRADSNASCAASAHTGIQCFEYRGFVTVTVQIGVELNGTSQFVDWSTTVRTIVPAKSLKSLKIRRHFNNSYFDVNFKRGDDSILGLTLVGGDRLTWAKK